MSERSSDIEFDFFEEPETGEATSRDRTVRRGPRRPPRPPAGLTPLLRLVGLITFAIAIVVLMVLWISSCRAEAKTERYKSYLGDVRQIADSSQRNGARLNGTITTFGIKQDVLVQRLEGLAQAEEQSLSNAQRLDPPGPLRAQQPHIVEALQLRVSGLRGLSDALTQTLRVRNPPTDAGAVLADQMRRLLASDVVWDDLFKDPTVNELRRQDVQGVEVPDSNFLGNPDLASTRSMDAILARLRARATGRTAVAGLHGNGIVSVRALPAGTVLSRDQVNEVVTSPELAFEVTVQNSGEFQELRVPVRLTILKSPAPIRKSATIDIIDAGEEARVVFRDIGSVPFVRTALKVEVVRVPGEENTANNSAEYPVTFSFGE